MGLFNYFSEIFNYDIVEDFNEFKSIHYEALTQWLGQRYSTRYIIPSTDKQLFTVSDSDYESFCFLSNNNKNFNIDRFSYKQKKFIVERKQQIIDCHELFKFYTKKYDTFKCLNQTYPMAIRYLAEKYLDISLSCPKGEKNLSDNEEIKVLFTDLDIHRICSNSIESIDKITIEQKYELIRHTDEITSITKLIAEDISKCLIKKEEEITHRRFVKEVLENIRRSKYYLRYLDYVNQKSEKYCLEHLNELDNFIIQTIESEYEHIKELYPEGIKQFDVLNEFSRGDNLLGIDYWENCVNNEDYIKELHVIGIKYNDLYERYPNGVKVYQETLQKNDDNSCSSFLTIKEEIVALGAEKLARLESISNTVKKYTAWEKNIRYFTTCSREDKDKYLESWGCYYYDLNVDYPSFYKEPNHMSYRICQHFIASYSTYPDLDYSNNESLKINFNVNLPKLRKCTRYYTTKVYDKIIDFIEAMKKRMGTILVLFGDSEIDDEKFNAYHFKYLRKKLAEKHVFYGSKVINTKYGYLYRYIIIVEVITSNKHLKEQCEEILSKFKEVTPYITYISLQKEMDFEETTALIKKTKERIKMQLEEEEKKRKEEIEKHRLEELNKQRIIQEKARLNKRVSKWYLPSYSELRCFSMYYYYPTTCDFVLNPDEWGIRNLIWDFKANPTKQTPEELIMLLHTKAAKIILEKMKICLTRFFEDDITLLTLVCIPSSKKDITKRRYEDFSKLVCESLKIENGYEHVSVSSEGEAKHTGGKISAQYDIDKDFFIGKYVLLFDDVITTGGSMEQFRKQLTSCGATVIGGFSIGNTTHERQASNPIDEIDRYITSNI